ncbi:uncharacterized protein ACB058_003470 [Synchiropus picturatus]
MDLIWLLTLFQSYSAVVSRPRSNDKAEILLSRAEIQDGDTMTISCLLPIIYRGGTCRLFRKHSTVPFRQMIAHTYDCDFHLTSSELLGSQPTGRVVRFKCDYTLQQYTSAFSDSAMMIVWGSRPSPSLSVRHHVISLQDTVEVMCTPPRHEASSYCEFYKDRTKVKVESCTYNITGSQLLIWENPALLTPVNLTCRYITDSYFRSEPSNHHMIFVVDAAQAITSTVCGVSLEQGEGEWQFDGGRESTVTVRASSSDQQTNNTCIAVSNQTSLEESGLGA